MRRRVSQIFVFLLLAVSSFVVLAHLSAPSVHADEVWTNLDGPYIAGGSVYALEIAPSSPQRLYALLGSPDGLRLFRSDDGADSWREMAAHLGTYDRSDPFFAGSLAVDPADADLLYVGTLEGVQRSTDGGKTWQPVYDMGGWVMAPTANRLYVVGSRPRQDGDTCEARWVFARSPDAGNTWEETDLPCTRRVGSVAASSVDPDLILLGVDPTPDRQGILRSADGGRTWQAVWTPSFPGVPPNGVAFDPRNSDVVYAVVAFTQHSSQDGGKTWSRCPWTGSPYPGDRAALTVTNEGVVYFAAVESGGEQSRVWRSEDGCQSWWVSGQASLPTSTLATVLRSAPDDPRRFYMGFRGAGLWRSENGGSAWQERNEGIATLGWVTRLAASPDNTALYAVTGIWGDARAGLSRSGDGGAHWSSELLDTRIRDVAVAPGDSLVWAVTYDGKLYSGWGASPNRQWNQDQSVGFTVTSVDISAQDANVRLLGGYDSTGPYTSEGVLAVWMPPTEEGAVGSWSASTVLTDVTSIDAVAIHPQNPDVMAAYGLASSLDVVLLSRDGGETWEEFFREGVDYGVCRPQRIYLDHDRLYLVCQGMPILFSPISSRAWTIWKPGPGWTFALAFLDDGTPIAATEQGVKLWHRGYRQWISIGFEGEQVTALRRVRLGGEDWLYAGTSHGVWRRPVPETPPLLIWLPTVGK